MPKITVKKTSQQPALDSFKKVAKMLETDHDLKKLDPNFKCNFDEKTMTGSAQGKQFKANLSVNSTGPSTEVEIEVELPLALIVIKGMIEKVLKKKLDETIG